MAQAFLLKVTVLAFRQPYMGTTVVTVVSKFRAGEFTCIVTAREALQPPRGQTTSQLMRIFRSGRVVIVSSRLIVLYMVLYPANLECVPGAITTDH